MCKYNYGLHMTNIYSIKYLMNKFKLIIYTGKNLLLTGGDELAKAELPYIYTKYTVLYFIGF